MSQNVNSKDVYSKYQENKSLENNSINNRDVKADKKEHERRIATERKLAHCKDEMSQLADRLATKSFQG